MIMCIHNNMRNYITICISLSLCIYIYIYIKARAEAGGDEVREAQLAVEAQVGLCV